MRDSELFSSPLDIQADGRLAVSLEGSAAGGCEGLS